MKLLLITCLSLLPRLFCLGQLNCEELKSKKFSKEELIHDLLYVRQTISNAHANPFTQITEDKFTSIFNDIQLSLKDSLTQKDFYLLMYPVFQLLGDEHAGLDKYCGFINNSIKNISTSPDNNKASNQPIIYQKIENIGYLTVNTFDDRNTFPIDVWRTKIDSVFIQINKDDIKSLLIDVQNNSGGNSYIGNILIDYFSDSVYTTYKGRWKRSLEYSNFLLQYDYVDSTYEKIPIGEYYELHSEKITPTENVNRFLGDVYVIIGKKTFSSALMFATIVQDNGLATLIGESPKNGHPNHFGELIISKTPNTQLEFWFGVKEWIRPSGMQIPNILKPTFELNLSDLDKKQIIELIK